MVAPGTILQGRYLIDAPIGAGGMGAVYTATDRRLGTTVAVKESFFATDQARRAFRREAQLLAGLDHPALPRVTDHFDEDGGQYLVMQYVPGEDLAARLERLGGPAPLADALAWADQLL